MSTKIAFYHGKSDKWYYNVMNFAIRVWTFGKYNHCELINCPTEDPADWEWYSSSSFADHGTRKKWIEPKPEKWHIFDLPNGIDYTGSFTWMDYRLGKKYDWVGIFLSQFIHTGINNPKRWFCSEYVVGGLHQSTLMRGDHLTPQSYSPNRLFRSLTKLGVLTKWQK